MEDACLSQTCLLMPKVGRQRAIFQISAKMEGTMKNLPCMETRRPERARTSLRGRHALALAVPLVLGAGSAQAEDWRWSLTPYIWGISTEFSTAANGPGGGEQDFGDIVDKLDFAAQVHLEGSGARWGFLLDATTLQTSDRTQRDMLELKTDAATTLVEGAAVLTAGDPETHAVDLLFGARLIGVDVDVTGRDGEGGDPVFEGTLDDTLTDAMFGVRYRTMLGQNWSFVARADAASGDPDYTANVSVVVGRQFGPRGALRIGYRYLDVQFERGDELIDPALVINGPMVGYTFSF